MKLPSALQDLYSILTAVSYSMQAVCWLGHITLMYKRTTSGSYWLRDDVMTVYKVWLFVSRFVGSVFFADVISGER
jgi:hypothetical protein